MTRVIARDDGYPSRSFDIPAFIGEMNRLCTRDDVLYPLVDFFNRSHPKISAMQDKRYNNDEYRKARSAGSAGRQDPELADTVGYIMKFMLGEGLVPRAVRRSAPTPPAQERAQEPWRKATYSPR